MLSIVASGKIDGEVTVEDQGGTDVGVAYIIREAFRNGRKEKDLLWVTFPIRRLEFMQLAQRSGWSVVVVGFDAYPFHFQDVSVAKQPILCIRASSVDLA
jgi:hypothetical protein